MIRQLPRIPSDAVIPSPRPQKKNRKTSVSFSPARSAERFSVLHPREAPNVFAKITGWQPKYFGANCFFFFLAALMFYKTISSNKLFKVIAQGAVLCVMVFCDTHPSQKAIQLLSPPPLATIVCSCDQSGRLFYGAVLSMASFIAGHSAPSVKIHCHRNCPAPLTILCVEPPSLSGAFRH